MSTILDTVCGTEELKYMVLDTKQLSFYSFILVKW